MPMRTLVSTNGEFREVTLKSVVGELDLGRTILPAARRRIKQWQRSGIRNQTAFIVVATPALSCNAGSTSAFADLVRAAFEKVLLTVITICKNEVVVEDETRIVKKVHNDGQVGDRNEPRRRLSAIDVLAPRIQRRREQPPLAPA